MSDIVERLRMLLGDGIGEEAAKEIESLRKRVEFESHKCSKCGTNLGLLHEDACPLCNCRQRVKDQHTLIEEIGEELGALKRENQHLINGIGQGDPVAFQVFNEWMHREMPSGTIIGDSGWWASRIYRHFIEGKNG